MLINWLHIWWFTAMVSASYIRGHKSKKCISCWFESHDIYYCRCIQVIEPGNVFSWKNPHMELDFFVFFSRGCSVLIIWLYRWLFFLLNNILRPLAQHLIACTFPMAPHLQMVFKTGPLWLGDLWTSIFTLLCRMSVISPAVPLLITLTLIIVILITFCDEKCAERSIYSTVWTTEEC